MSTNLPLVSFLLPIRNEVSFIRECLEAIRAQDYARDLLEIIVIDGASDDGTKDILAELSLQEPRLKVIENPARIVPAAMNLGLRLAQGEVIIRVDGHAVVPPDYARRCVEGLVKEAV